MNTVTLHATTVAVQGRGLLILGPSGSGKSSLALELMAYGARLVADDRTLIAQRGTVLVARAPPAISGMIEARQIGLLNADVLPETDLTAALDLAQTEEERLPQSRKIDLLGGVLPLLYRPAGGHFAAAVLQYMRSGRRS